jgi:[ribosomal protein S18]-alanine N-acetyltransferase
LSYRVRLMRVEDIPRASEIDREVFPTMKIPTNFENELKNCLAHYIVVCDDRMPAIGQNDGEYIIGFAGLWILVGEAHVVNIATKPDYRRRGIGELLLLSLIELALNEYCNLLTLEVRASNGIAQKLYEKYGFTVRGARKGYYTDNREDAIIMTVNDIGSSPFQELYKKLREAYYIRWGIPDIKLTPSL